MQLIFTYYSFCALNAYKLLFQYWVCSNIGLLRKKCSKTR